MLPCLSGVRHSVSFCTGLWNVSSAGHTILWVMVVFSLLKREVRLELAL